MVDVLLIIASIVSLGILVVSGIYLIVYYQHPDDHNEAYGPKVVVLLGYVFAGITVLLLPLDVANNEGYAGCAGYASNLCGGMPMEILWNHVFFLIPIWVFVMIPFSTFYYEADDGMLMAGTKYAPDPVKKSRFASAMCYQMFVFVIVGSIFVGCYFGMNETFIPVRHYTGPNLNATGREQYEQNLHTYNGNDNFNFTTRDFEDLTKDEHRMSELIVMVSETPPQDMEIALKVSVGTFFAAFMAWIGWFLLAVFGGVGLAAVPMDFILTFVNRPRHLDAKEFAEVSTMLKERVNELVDIGELLKIEREEKLQAGLGGAFSGFSFDSERRQAAREERQAILGFKQAVLLLEQDADDFKAHTDQREHYNPLVPYISIVLGVASALISFLWIIHMIVYVFPPKPFTPFLNTIFIWFDGWFPLFGVLSVAIFTSYLLLCAITGCFKIGLRFLCMDVHPMKMGKTYMSSFMFNIALVLLCAMPVVQFCQAAFADYAAYSEIRSIFGVQIQHLKFFSNFWTGKYFVYAMFSMFWLSIIYFSFKPKDTPASGQALRDRLRARN